MNEASQYNSLSPDNKREPTPEQTEAERRADIGRTMDREHAAKLYGFEHVPWFHVRALARASRADAIGAIVETFRCYFGKQLHGFTDPEVLKLSDDKGFAIKQQTGRGGFDNLDTTFRMYEETLFFRNCETGLIHADIPDSARKRYVAGATEAQEHKADATHGVHHASQSIGAVSTEDTSGKRPGSKKGQRGS